MSQCQRCRKYVHTGCDPEADRSLVQRKKEMNADYDYLCPPCKITSPSIQGRPVDTDPSATTASTSIDFQDPQMAQQTSSSSSMLSSELSLESCAANLAYGDESTSSNSGALQMEDVKPIIGPAAVRAGQKVMASQQSAGKLARKRISGPTSTGGGGAGGRPKGSGKTSSFGAAAGASGAAYNRKANKLADFGRKRGPKPKMRGVFGAPGVGLQRPAGSDVATGHSNNASTSGTVEGEPCLENKLILCSSTDSFVVEQDACAMCGSFGLDQEGRLISCAQCGQVYFFFYLVNNMEIFLLTSSLCFAVLPPVLRQRQSDESDSAKRMALSRLVIHCTNSIICDLWLTNFFAYNSTVCEGCGERHDEARLLLCDECDISYHIYCMEPPLDYVPQGNCTFSFLLSFSC